MGMASSRKEARQLVLHSHFTLNGKKVSIPSILVKAGDVIAVKETSKDNAKIKALAESAATATTPKWIEKDAANLATTVVSVAVILNFSIAFIIFRNTSCFVLIVSLSRIA